MTEQPEQPERTPETTITVVIFDDGATGVECAGKPISKATALGVLEIAKTFFLKAPAPKKPEEGTIEVARTVPPFLQ